MAEPVNYTLITGGSSGIGKALAKECADRKMDILLVALDTPELEETAMEIRNEFSVMVHTLGTDLTEKGGPAKVLEWCTANQLTVQTLINNAGIAGTEVFADSPVDYSDVRIQLNIRALVLLSRLFITELKKHPRAYILNIGSFSAYHPLAYKSVYAASKAFVMSFSKGLNEELRGTRISVSLINPNGVRTNSDAHERINSHGKIARLVILPAEKIAGIAIKGMLNSKSVMVPGFWNRVLLHVMKIIPPRIRMRRAAIMFRKELPG